MDMLAGAIVLVICSTLLLIVGRFLDRKRTNGELILMKKDMPGGLPDRRPIVDVQVPPTGSSNPVVNVLKRVQAKSDAKTDDALATAARSKEARHTAEFNLQVLPVKQYLEQQRLQKDIIGAEDDVHALKQARKERALAEEAASQPKVPSKADVLRVEADEIKAEAERLEAQIKLDRLKKEHGRIVNPPDAKRELRPEEELIERLERELDRTVKRLKRPTKEQAKVKARLICELNDITDPVVIARFERQAIKVYEDLARQWDEG